MSTASPEPGEDTIWSEEIFEDQWGAHVRTDGEFYSHADVFHRPRKTVWTVVEGDDDSLIALPGFRAVNKVGYVLTTRPWVTGREQAYWLQAAPEDSED